MMSTSLMVLLALAVWVVSYGPPDRRHDTQEQARSEIAFAELTAMFDKPTTPPDRTTRLL